MAQQGAEICGHLRPLKATMGIWGVTTSGRYGLYRFKEIVHTLVKCTCMYVCMHSNCQRYMYLYTYMYMYMLCTCVYVGTPTFQYFNSFHCVT